jgi:hypothetical protein
VSVTEGSPSIKPPQTIIFEPVQTAVWRYLGEGAFTSDVGVHATHPGIFVLLTAPVLGSQASVVQAFPSSMTTGPWVTH